jgi:hypothetical protein
MLNKKIRNYALSIHYKQRKKRPAFVSGAQYKPIFKYAKSGDIEVKDFVQSLIVELQAYGNIGEKYRNSSIGYCAEVISCNRVLQVLPINYSSVNVGVAIRPRTMQIGKRCLICNNLFK